MSEKPDENANTDVSEISEEDETKASGELSDLPKAKTSVQKVGSILAEQFPDVVKLEKLMNHIDEQLDLEELTTGSDVSDLEEEEYTPPAVCKLRALARVVMINLRWAKDIRKTHEYDGFESSCRCPQTGLMKRVFFKVDDFTAKKRIISGLTPEEKQSLKLHPIGRSEHDLETISKIFERYRCFDKFAPTVKKELAVWVRYDTFEDARTLLRQGHEPYSMYFILTGSVMFKASDTDSRTGRTNIFPLGIRGPNSIIGEIELLNADERRSTGVTIGDVELLRVDEDAFNDVLRTSFEAIFEERFAVLRSAQIFESWNDHELRILNENSSLVSFEENKPILTDVYGPCAFSYFIQKGRCALVKDVVFERTFYNNDYRCPVYKALDMEDERRWIAPSKLKEYPDLEGHHLNITEFKEGDYFGVGENLRRSHLITKSAVECLTIPRSVFEKARRLQFLQDLRADLEDAIPSDEQILAEWLALQSWQKFKKRHLKHFWMKIAAEEHAKFFDMHRKYRLSKFSEP